MQKVAALLVLCASGLAHADELAVPESVVVPAQPPRMEPPRPRASPEIAKLGKQLEGTWTCSGALGKLDIKLALGNAWIEWRGTRDGIPFVERRTFDDVSKQWTRIAIAGTGSYQVSTSLGDEHGAWTWSGGTHRVVEQQGKGRIAISEKVLVGPRWVARPGATCSR